VVRIPSVSGITTYAAWLLETNNANEVAEVLDELSKRLIHGRSATATDPGYEGFSRDFTEPTPINFVPGETYGTVEWWRRGEQAKNRTRNMAPNVLRRLFDSLDGVPEENTDGPDRSAAPSVIDQVMSVGKGLLIAGAISGGVYAIYRLTKSSDDVGSRGSNQPRSDGAPWPS
jgi:hypothetical protein